MYRRRSRITTTLSLLMVGSLVCLVGAVPPAAGKVISVTLANATSASPGRMVSTDLAGAPGVRVGNWNNLTNTNLILGDSESVVCDDGTAAEGVQIAITTPRSFSNRDNNSAYKNDQIMYNGVIDCYNDTTTLTLKNIPFAQYQVYFYMRDDGAARAGSFTLVGGPTYYLRGTAGNPTADGTGYVLSTDTTMTSGDGTSINPGNYTVFEGLSGDNTFQVTAVNAGDATMRNKWTGFQIVAAFDPAQANKPAPKDKATDVLRDVALSWLPSVYAATHDVYFGTVFEDVNTASRSDPRGVLVAQGQDANTYDPTGVLPYGQTYYWRVDEVNAPPSNVTTKGQTWTFTVEPVSCAISTVTATASSSMTNMGPEKTINGSGLNTAGQHGTTDTTMWLSSITGAQPTWIQYQFDRVYKLQQMWVWNSNQVLEPAVGFGIQTATVEYSVDGVNWTALPGVPEFAQATATDDYAHNTTVDFGGVAAQYVKITPLSNWGGMPQYGLSEVRFFYIPVQAREPSPANSATGVSPDVLLKWRTGREAVSHNVYVGADPNALAPAGAFAGNSYAPAGLLLGTKYYWRVDEVNAVEPIGTWTGDLWNFTTSPTLVIDDMESYNDKTNKIFSAWVDGYDTPSVNGSVVGLTTAANNTFGNTTTYHGGRQSMPLSYSNTAAVPNSEATRTFDSAQDWTLYGIKTLTLYFYGQATNTTTVPLWVKLTDQSGKSAKVTFGAAAGEDPLVLADLAWTAWNIPLSSFSGIGLAKVKSMTLGLGNGTGSGTLLIDDICLTPTTPSPAVASTLVGWWKLDNDLKDSSGNGNNGTIGGAPTYVAAGKLGASMKFNGTADYVDCGAGTSLNITDQITLAAWIKPTDITASGQHDIVGKGDHAYAMRVSAGQVQFYFYYSAGWHQFNGPTYTSTFSSIWHHVAATYDGVQVRIYVDGAIVTSGLYTGGLASAAHSVSIGRNTESTGRWYSGELDDVRIYRGVLPTAEVRKLANP